MNYVNENASRKDQRTITFGVYYDPEGEINPIRPLPGRVDGQSEP